MKKFNDDIFKPYIFPIILAFLTVYFRENLDFKPISKFFSSNSNKFVDFFNVELYLWQVILYGIIIYLILKIYSVIFNSKTKDERRMLGAIKRYPKLYTAIVDGDTFPCKYKLSVKDEQYVVNNFTPYCQNCTNEPIRMTSYSYGTQFSCNCGRLISYKVIKDIKSRIITEVEKHE